MAACAARAWWPAASAWARSADASSAARGPPGGRLRGDLGAGRLPVRGDADRRYAGSRGPELGDPAVGRPGSVGREPDGEGLADQLVREHQAPSVCRPHQQSRPERRRGRVARHGDVDIRRRGGELGVEVGGEEARGLQDLHVVVPQGDGEPADQRRHVGVRTAGRRDVGRAQACAHRHGQQQRQPTAEGQDGRRIPLVAAPDEVVLDIGHLQRSEGHHLGRRRAR